MDENGLRPAKPKIEQQSKSLFRLHSLKNLLANVTILASPINEAKTNTSQSIINLTLL
ncbi:hypothetical protein BOSE62_30221 [Bosea sp. 62]|nr:hypothetical protein BOSE46_140010 [Bosea sp. 46]CAD5268038.1 hypothetical protein BOSE21B_111405 [Bosea sp. 21B]CAD5270665.1 hypothetical protein BOSE7B_20234 [Bosea sp. 7B]VVT62351.1 hypothetical protein BOS5A_80011 [Bosea sp. EC-HK365B]VXB89256.1 hypothetical protein BOSE29B_150005 [Bosea sp. 29B]VXC14381.1 hypothetical protein BOSE62_30221 [Bosea sp. 62]VXC27827.1 hypothetical protein BOSE125_190012 [Bosea sp. 125]VXC66584.1 hypothetical protein BOSE127_30250 [Bosea sp. 127]